MAILPISFLINPFSHFKEKDQLVLPIEIRPLKKLKEQNHVPKVPREMLQIMLIIQQKKLHMLIEYGIAKIIMKYSK